MAKVDEGSAGDIECVMPAIRVLVLVSLLYPLEDLEKGFELDFSISQVDVFKATLVALSAASKLEHKAEEEVIDGIMALK